jgi:ketosteroid isomerase-like protein
MRVADQKTELDELEQELLRRERERQDALVADDMERFASLLCDDLVHVHATGNVHGKSELLGHAGGFLRFLQIERGELLVRPLSDNAAVVTGSMRNTVKRRGFEERVDVDAYVTQVWVRDSGSWKIKSFHAVRLPDVSPATPTEMTKNGIEKNG